MPAAPDSTLPTMSAAASASSTSSLGETLLLPALFLCVRGSLDPAAFPESVHPERSGSASSLHGEARHEEELGDRLDEFDSEHGPLLPRALLVVGVAAGDYEFDPASRSSLSLDDSGGGGLLGEAREELSLLHGLHESGDESDEEVEVDSHCPRLFFLEDVLEGDRPHLLDGLHEGRVRVERRQQRFSCEAHPRLRVSRERRGRVRLRRVFCFPQECGACSTGLSRPAVRTAHPVHPLSPSVSWRLPDPYYFTPASLYLF